MQNTPEPKVFGRALGCFKEVPMVVNGVNSLFRDRLQKRPGYKKHKAPMANGRKEINPSG